MRMLDRPKANHWGPATAAAVGSESLSPAGVRTRTMYWYGVPSSAVSSVYSLSVRSAWPTEQGCSAGRVAEDLEARHGRDVLFGERPRDADRAARVVRHVRGGHVAHDGDGRRGRRVRGRGRRARRSRLREGVPAREGKDACRNRYREAQGRCRLRWRGSARSSGTPSRGRRFDAPPARSEPARGQCATTSDLLQGLFEALGAPVRLLGGEGERRSAPDGDGARGDGHRAVVPELPQDLVPLLGRRKVERAHEPAGP